MKIYCALAVVLTLPVSAALCDEQPNEADVSESRQSVQVELTQSTTQDGADTKAETKVNGRIVISDADGTRREYSIGKGGAVAVDEAGNLVLKQEGAKSSGPAALDDNQPRFMIGVACEPASEVLRRHLKLEKTGLVVVRVFEGLPAAQAGIQRHDILLAAGETEFMDLKDLVDVVSTTQENPLQITLLRDGEKKILTVTPRRMTALEARTAMGLHDAVSDSEERISAGDQTDSWRHLVFGPGIRLEQGGDMELEKMIAEAHALARKHLAQGTESTSADQDLRRRLQELQKQVEQLAQRLEAVEKE
ncbi:MAG: PDZ domain-containing protein [Fuerstiella sp.]